MFSNVTSILTMTVMLLHSMLGCCWHHVHACEHGPFVGKCPVEHGEHDSEFPEAAHTDKEHEEHVEHDACADVGHAAESRHGSVAQGTLDTVGEDGLGSRGLPEHPHDPCQQTCDGADCSFTQPSQVKTPAPDDGRLIFPVTTLVVPGVSIVGCLSAVPVDSGLPGGVAYCCCRSMTQIWRL